MLWPVMAADPASVRVEKRFWWWTGTMVRLHCQQGLLRVSSCAKQAMQMLHGQHLRRTWSADLGAQQRLCEAFAPEALATC